MMAASALLSSALPYLLNTSISVIISNTKTSGFNCKPSNSGYVSSHLDHGFLRGSIDIDTILQYQRNLTSNVIPDYSQLFVIQRPDQAPSMERRQHDADGLRCSQPAYRCIDNIIHSAAGSGLREACYQIIQKPEPWAVSKPEPGSIFRAMKYTVRVNASSFVTRTY